MAIRMRALNTLATACTAGGLLAGCSGSDRMLEPLTGPAGPRLGAADFRAPDAPRATLALADSAPVLPPAQTSGGAGLPANPTAAVTAPALADTDTDADPGTVEAVVGGPDLSGTTPPPVEPAALLDIKVGDVNGRPIFAGEFFADMERRLIEESREKPRRLWTADTTARIREKLGGIIAGELLRAEALELLPQEQREVGLGRVMDRERAAIQSRAGGSLTQAQRKLMEDEGLTIEEYLTRFQDQSLVQLSLQQMRQQVQISGRDIRNYYERNYDTYNPSPSAQLREIVVLSSNTQAVAAVQAQLDEGVPFEEVAAGPLNTSTFRQAGGLREVPLEGEYRGANLFRNDALNAAAWELEAGEWAGPIRYGPDEILTAWIFLERVTTKGQTLYEAQIQIQDELRRTETSQRLRQTIERLGERASFTSEEVMVRRLLEIATERYYPPGQPEPTAPTFSAPRPQ